MNDATPATPGLFDRALRRIGLVWRDMASAVAGETDDSVEAQIQGGLIFGLTAALYNEITIAKGRVQQSNFNNYRMMRINEAPAIDVHLIRNGEAPGGIGEPGTSIAAPALANALFAATGVRFRSLPIDRKQLALGKAA